MFNHNESVHNYFIGNCKNTKYEQQRTIQSCTEPKSNMNDSGIHSLKLVALKYNQPQRNKKCTIMLLSNLARPEWVSVSCHQKIIGDVLCFTRSNLNFPTNMTVEAHLVVFESPFVFINGKCYSFFWGFQNEILGFENLTIAKSTLHTIQYLVTAINGEFPPFHYQSLLAVYCKVDRKWTFQKVKEPYKGLHIILLSGSSYTNYGNVFECEQGIFVAYCFVCDGKKDCPGDEAFIEMACSCEENVDISKKCKLVVSKDGIKTCSLFYLTMKDGTCLLYEPVNSMKMSHQTFNSSTSFKPIFKSDLKLTCQDNGQLSCKPRYRNCYNITELCSYRLDENNLLTPCETGEHIENCRDIQCNMKFKCKDFYCIPWGYVCDGKWDCPGGYDEIKELGSGVKRHCKNMFRCTNSQKCIHIGDVCNGMLDCPAEDDEYMCSLTGSVCLSSCVCLGFAIKCYNISAEIFITSTHSYNALFLNHCDLNFLKPLLKILNLPAVLSLTCNNLNFVCEILPGLGNMLMIDLGFNQIDHLNRDCFKNGLLITSIMLNNNLIPIFYKAVLYHLINLSYLDLSNNIITKLFIDSNLLISYLEILSIKNNILTEISDSTFDNFNLKILVTDEYFICCNLPSNSICTSVKLWFESCKHLLLHRSITVYVFCFSTLLIISNVVATFLQMISNRKNKECYGAFQYVAISVNILYLTWGIYLKFLVVFDFLFKDNFILHKSLWQSSFICHFLCSINLNYNILSRLLNNFISFTRFMVVMYPLDSNLKSKTVVLRCCILMYSLAAIIVVIYILLHLGMCMNVYHSDCALHLLTKLILILW